MDRLNEGSGVSCSVEYAQSQLKPKRVGAGSNRHQPKPDVLQGTIEDDEHFKQFLAEISAPVAAPSSEMEPTPPRGLTPLLLAIKKKDLQKFEERKNARNGKKKNKKKNKTKAASNAPTATSTPATPAKTPSKRNKNSKKNRNKKANDAGPQFGNVKIMTASPSTSASTPSPSNTTPTLSSSSPATPSSEAKKRPPRRPKGKKSGGDPASAKRAAQPAS